MCASEGTHKVNEGFKKCFLLLFDLIYDISQELGFYLVSVFFITERVVIEGKGVYFFLTVCIHF